MKFDSYKKSKFIEIFTFIFILISIIGISLYVSKHNTEKIINQYKNASIFYTVLFLYICYSIPFLWNVYEKILNIKEYISESDIQNLLTTEYYSIRLNNYRIYLQYPIILIIFSTLFIIPLFDFLIGGIFLMILALYFFFMPQIYQLSKHVSYLSFKNFLENERPDSYNTQKVFQELWKKSEHFLLKIFSLEEKDIFDIFKQKIDNLIKTNHFDRLNNLLHDFYNYIDYRNEIFLINNTLLYFLDFHFLIWKKSQKIKERVSDSLNTINYIVEKIEMISLKNKRNSEFYTFIKFFKMHLNYIKQHYKNEYELYIKHLFKTFTFTLLRTTDKNISLYKWRDYFPNEWKVSKEKIKNNKSIPSSIFDNFTKYINNNLYNIIEEREKIIINIIKVIFKNFDPNLLMRLLFFVLSQPIHKKEINRDNIENLIINLNSFELTKFNIDEAETAQTAKNQISDYKNVSEINTFDFIIYMFPNIFNEDTANSIINYLEELKAKYSNEPSAYYNIETYHTILSRISKLN